MAGSMADRTPSIAMDDLTGSPRRIILSVEADQAGERLDRFLAAATEVSGLNLSRTRLKSLIEEGNVQIDGAQASAASIPVRSGQIITLNVPPAIDPAPIAEDIPLAIVFEDANLIVLDKPAGLVVHPAAGHETGTLVNALIAHCGDTLSGIGGVKRPGIVHRLDKDTSGLLVVAKNDAAHKGLAQLFADHGKNLWLEREYLAFVWGVPERPSGIIDAPLGRHTIDRERIAITKGERGRHAVTHWRLVEIFERPGGTGQVASLIACQLETGRTHQIRVHMAHMGHPVLGDPVYGKGFQSKAALLSPEARTRLASLHRQALHAARLGFTHPVSGEDLHFESPLPADLQALHEALQLKKG